MMSPRYGSEPRFQGSDKPLEESNVKSMLNDYLKSTGNPNLKLGEINEKESAFEAEILTKDGSLVVNVDDFKKARNDIQGAV